MMQVTDLLQYTGILYCMVRDLMCIGGVISGNTSGHTQAQGLLHTSLCTSGACSHRCCPACPPLLWLWRCCLQSGPAWLPPGGPLPAAPAAACTSAPAMLGTPASAHLGISGISLQDRQSVALGHRAYTWESGSLNDGGQHSYHAISLHHYNRPKFCPASVNGRILKSHTYQSQALAACCVL